MILSSVESARQHKANRGLEILCVAPFAPPINHAEPIQVGRYLSTLLERDRVALVSERPAGSWSVVDPGLAIHSENLRRLELALPLHDLSSRLIGLPWWGRSPFRIGHWPLAYARRIARWAGNIDIIYSRSMPSRAALLARKLRSLTGKPWIMHLSDPWADSPHARGSLTDYHREEADERACFAAADAIALTTSAMAEFYRAKYPSQAKRIFVSPNVFPRAAKRAPLKWICAGGLRLVYTGALYGNRQPDVLIDAIEALPLEWKGRVRLIIAGNAVPEALAAMSKAGPDIVEYHGHLPFADAVKLQESADLLVTLEDSHDHPLDGTFLLSKLLDYLPAGVPLLCLTPQGSVTQNLVNGNYGWAVPSCDRQGITSLLVRLLSGDATEEMGKFRTDLPSELGVECAVDTLRSKMTSLMELKC